MMIEEYMRECVGVLRDRIGELSSEPQIEGLLRASGQSRHATTRAVQSFLQGRLSQADHAVFAELSLRPSETERALEILRDEIVAQRLAVGVVEDLVAGLVGIERRIIGGYAAWMLLPHDRLPASVERYYARVIRIYVAGGSFEIFVLCRSMLEAALEVGAPDEELRAAGLQPRPFFSIWQRVDFLERKGALKKDHRALLKKVVDLGNRVAHGKTEGLPDELEGIMLACSCVSALVRAM